jgi:hypothetical protein
VGTEEVRLFGAPILGKGRRVEDSASRTIGSELGVLRRSG